VPLCGDWTGICDEAHQLKQVWLWSAAVAQTTQMDSFGSAVQRLCMVLK
jgi:hypothetical protein